MCALAQDLADAEDGANADFFDDISDLREKMQSVLQEYLVFEMNGGGCVEW